MPTATSGATNRRNHHNHRNHRPRAPRDDGRRRPDLNTGTIRQSIRSMGRRASPKFREVLQVIYWFTGTIVEKMQYRRIAEDRGLTILELCREMSRNLWQGNVPRAWSSLLALLNSYQIETTETLELEKYTHVRRVFKAVAEEVVQPGLSNLPGEIIMRCAELGFDVRPVSEQLGIGLQKPNPQTFDSGSGYDNAPPTPRMEDLEWRENHQLPFDPDQSATNVIIRVDTTLSALALGASMATAYGDVSDNEEMFDV